MTGLVEVRPGDSGTILLVLQGSWTVTGFLPDPAAVAARIASSFPADCLTFDSNSLQRWDTGLLTFLSTLLRAPELAGLPHDFTGLPAGVRRLLDLAGTAPRSGPRDNHPSRGSALSRIGTAAIDAAAGALSTLHFTGEVTRSLGAALRGRARFQRRELLVQLQRCGPGALPIVSLISLLVGLIFAFVGAVQLRMFGAQIYVADLVGISMVRVISAVMTGIIMAGRTGAAFAAELGTMQTNDEIDALHTMGISPIEFLVLPRLLALTCMMPLLGVYADCMGILGGMIVGVGILDLNIVEYWLQTRSAVTSGHVAIGLVHTAVFGVIVALTGCGRGLRCGRTSAAVGQATTSAVVASIVGITVATALITIACNVLGV